MWGWTKVIPAFRWIDGKVIALSFGGTPGLDLEYLYLHLQKRPMKFTPGLENENSFMVIPNEFVKDHELTQNEIQELMTPDPEFEQAQRAKYPGIGVPAKPSFLQRINIIKHFKHLIKTLVKRAVRNDPAKILALKQRWNRFRGRTLPSKF